MRHGGRPCGNTGVRVVWDAGEQRPTHRSRYVRFKPIVRPSMLDTVRDQQLAWLEAQHALATMAALERLRVRYPNRFTADHLRTVQRFMKVRRLTMAREVLVGSLPLPPASVPGTTGARCRCYGGCPSGAEGGACQACNPEPGAPGGHP